MAHMCSSSGEPSRRSRRRSGSTLAVGAASLAVLLVPALRLPEAATGVDRGCAARSSRSRRSTSLPTVSRSPATSRPACSRLACRTSGRSDVGELLIGAFAVVFVGYSETLAAARNVARKYRYELDTNQELVAQGVANGAAGLIGGFVVDGSLSKTSVADDAGQKTEVASLINAAFVLATMLFLATLFESLPAATLGAIVIDAMVGLITLDALGALLPGQPRRLGVLRRCGARDPRLRHDGRNRHRGGPLARDAHRARLAHQHQAPAIATPPPTPTTTSHGTRDWSRFQGSSSRESTGHSSSPTPDRFRERLHELVLEEEAPTCVVVDAAAVHLTRHRRGGHADPGRGGAARTGPGPLRSPASIHRSSPSGNVPGRSTRSAGAESSARCARRSTRSPPAVESGFVEATRHESDPRPASSPSGVVRVKPGPLQHDAGSEWRLRQEEPGRPA